jgi:hypothetical protein
VKQSITLYCKSFISNNSSMQSRFRIILGIFFKVILIGLLLSKIYFLPHSHAYHRFINAIFFGLCLAEIYLSYKSINYVGTGVAFCCALIFNPFFKWGFGRSVWHLINFSFSSFLIIWIVFDIIFYIGDVKFRHKFKQHIGLFDRI